MYETVSLTYIILKTGTGDPLVTLVNFWIIYTYYKQNPTNTNSIGKFENKSYYMKQFISFQAILYHISSFLY